MALTKTKKCTSIGCSAKFLLGVWNFSLYKFSDILGKRFCHHSLTYQFFCHQAICIHCLVHPQPNIFIWKKPGLILCADTSVTFGAKVSNSTSSSVLSVVATAAGEFKGASSLPSICICHLPTACLSFNFSSLLIILKVSREIQGSKNTKLRLSCRTLPSTKLPVQSNFCPPYHKPQAFFPLVPHHPSFGCMFLW